MGTEIALLYGLLVMIWIEDAWHLFLVWRQRDVVKTTATMPNDLHGIMSVETYSKARLYSLDRLTFGITHSLFDSIVGAIVILAYLIPFFWKCATFAAEKVGYADSEILVSIIFMIIVSTLSTLVSIPFQLYSTFVIEERYGFNKQTISFFVKDAIKSYLLMLTFIIILVAPIVYIIKAGGQYFFVYLWLFTVLFTLFFMTIYPDVIAPLFDKYTPLEDGELKTSIENLASRINFPLKKIFVVEGSKRSSHSNAYFYGFFKNKRIVLFDTLLKDKPTNSTETSETPLKSDEQGESEVTERKGLSNDEILAVLAHELGHWKGNHVFKQLLITQVNLFLLFVAFSYLFKYDIIYKAFGFYDSQPIIIGLFVIFQFIFTPYNFVMSFLVTLLSRKYEFEADRFAIDLGKAEHLGSSLIKLNKDNLGFPINDWLYSLFTHSHPPLLERLAVLNKTN